MKWPTAIAALALAAACGDNHPGVFQPTDVYSDLAALPGVTVVRQPTDTEGYDFLVLHFTQPVDHQDPTGATFQQRVSLLHRTTDVPLVALTSGYYDYYLDQPYELTRILGANQISIEHRFFGESRPDPEDWSKLTIEQMAADEHLIISALRTIYDGPVVTTGGSKGGMTATYHRRFFPADVDATVAYVAPLSIAAPDDRYTAYIDQIGPASCRDALRAAAIEMLQNRRAALEARAGAQFGHVYTRIKLGPAVEASIAALEWAFWQYAGVGQCDRVPPPTATDDELFDFLDSVAPIGDNDDRQTEAFEAYYFQAYAQLGYPANNATYLAAFTIYDDADYDGALPTARPPYDGGAAMADVANFVATAGDRLMFIYGEWDPWSGGQYDLGGATDSFKFVQPQGSHGSRINRLAPADVAVAYERLSEWTQLTLNPPQAKSARRGNDQRAVVEPRLPSALLRVTRGR